MKQKCERYWPEVESDVQKFDHMCITFEKESQIEDDEKNPVNSLIRRNFEVSNRQAGNKQAMQFNLYCYSHNMLHIMYK